MNERQARTLIAAHLDKASRPGAAEECRAGKGYQEMVKAVADAYELGRLTEIGKGIHALNIVQALANTPWKQWQGRKAIWGQLADFRK